MLIKREYMIYIAKGIMICVIFFDMFMTKSNITYKKP